MATDAKKKTKRGLRLTVTAPTRTTPVLRLRDISTVIRRRVLAESTRALGQRGRPLKLTPTVIAIITKKILAGNYRNVAAESAGVTADSLTNWMKRGSTETTGIFSELFRAVVAAEHQAEIAAVDLVLTAATIDAKHAEWWLERKFHERWGRKDRMEVTGRAGGPIELSTYVYLPANGRELDPAQVRSMPDDVVDAEIVKAIPERVEPPASDVVILPPSGRENGAGG